MPKITGRKPDFTGRKPDFQGVRIREGFYTWQGVYPNGTPNATTGIQGYRDSRFQVDSTLTIDLTKHLQFSIFGRNVFNKPDVYFLTKERRIVNNYTRYGTYWSFGIRGRY